MAAFSTSKQFSIDVETEMFNQHVKDFLAKAGVEVEKGIKKFAFDLVKRIILKNPVDTGRSRAAWYVSFNRLGGWGTPTLKRSSKRLDPKAIAEGFSKGKFIDHTKGFSNKWVEMVNGVSYILFLEYGHSRQAPYGMVRMSMREMRGGKLPRDLGARLRKKWNLFYYKG